MSTKVITSQPPEPPVAHPMAHPQLHAVEPARPKANPLVSLLVWLIILAAIAVAAWLIWKYVKDAKAAAAAQSGKVTPPVPVVVQTVAPADIHVYDPGIGIVTAYNTVTVHTQVDGILQNVAFKNKEGKLVQQGELLAEIDKRPFQAAVDQAQGNLNKDQATLANARKDLQRYLDAPTAVTAQDLATQTTLVKQLAATITSDQAMLEAAQVNLTYCTIYSPLTGLVDIRQVDEGNVVRITDATGITSVIQVQPIAVLFTLPQDQLPDVRDELAAGQTLAVEAWDREQKKLLEVGVLEAIGNQVDPTTGMIKMKARFPNSNLKLYPNEFVNAKLLVRTLQNTIACPSSAIQRGPTSVFVYVVKLDSPTTQPAPVKAADGTIRPALISGIADVRDVTPGPVEGDYTAIRQGLQAGDIVVTDGIDLLRPGAKVTVQFPKVVTPPPATRPATQPAVSPLPSHQP